MCISALQVMRDKRSKKDDTTYMTRDLGYDTERNKRIGGLYIIVSQKSTEEGAKQKLVIQCKHLSLRNDLEKSGRVSLLCWIIC